MSPRVSRKRRARFTTAKPKSATSTAKPRRKKRANSSRKASTWRHRRRISATRTKAIQQKCEALLLSGSRPALARAALFATTEFGDLGAVAAGRHRTPSPVSATRIVEEQARTGRRLALPYPFGLRTAEEPDRILRQGRQHGACAARYAQMPVLCQPQRRAGLFGQAVQFRARSG